MIDTCLGLEGLSMLLAALPALFALVAACLALAVAAGDAAVARRLAAAGERLAYQEVAGARLARLVAAARTAQPLRPLPLRRLPQPRRSRPHPAPTYTPWLQSVMDRRLPSPVFISVQMPD